MTIKFIHTFLLLAFLTHVESFTIRSTTTRLGASEAPTLPLTTALSPNTFAGRVEQGILQRFGTDAQRIVESWRLLDQDYEHNEFVGYQQTPPIMNREDSNCNQKCHSFVPGLPAKTFWDTENVEWSQKLKSKYKEIKKEFIKVCRSTMGNISLIRISC